MPINYLNVQPQIIEYCRHAVDQFEKRPQKIYTAIKLLHRFADELSQGIQNDLSVLVLNSPTNRCARPADESINETYPSQKTNAYNLLASDGSQISSSHHDALPISLVNTSTIFYQPHSGTAPQVSTLSEFLRNREDQISTDVIHESIVNTFRDLQEVQILANYVYTQDTPLITLSDGPLELFQEPRSSDEHQALFTQYHQALHALCSQGRIMAGYTDKPRANLIIRMLELVYKDEAKQDMQGITDADIFTQLLPVGSRSAIFELNSPSSQAYQEPISLHFFYLNVGSSTHPWIVRVEIMAYSAAQKTSVSLLQGALLDQCRLMGNRPYPYVLHRAHEEAVVHFDEREIITELLSHALREQGVEITSNSHKQNAKDLGKRMRLD